ncbi:hypothetical protein PHLGIDRAFT_471035 [Phlebiopsis gigantea 11061_1 CR5-6]|uniref:Uncharacterized protein n=1 Tax=Phlebiopsis gigantea (strain 11061_1 CR5-6) TaxID=745531 RepID=A0A0C3RWS9_PHLG1|nr:hypothetical protein PHLGIDRAFT_471035 [Phlebiopsis gigantea 11061_1 CR5-6]
MTVAASTQFILPSDYTFTPGGLLVHKDTYARAEKLMNQAQNRDPDMHDMYIYNDFFGYAVLELVDDTLSAIDSFVAKKKWLDAWNALFSLTVFNPMCGGVWKQVDDGDRVIATEKTFAALAVAIIRALESAEPSALNEETIPNLESALMDMAAWGTLRINHTWGIREVSPGSPPTGCVRMASS